MSKVSEMLATAEVPITAERPLLLGYSSYASDDSGYLLLSFLHFLNPNWLVDCFWYLLIIRPKWNISVYTWSCILL
jgi:hypothetical protein